MYNIRMLIWVTKDHEAQGNYPSCHNIAFYHVVTGSVSLMYCFVFSPFGYIAN